MDFFKNVELVPPDPILGLILAFQADTRPNKVNLGAGVYKTADLTPLILKSVKKAEAILLREEKSKDYLPIDGEKNYLEKAKELVFGNDLEVRKIYGTQTPGGTAALHVGGCFLKHLGLNTIFLSDPSWDNHQRIFNHCGFEVKFYPYYSRANHTIDFKSMINALNTIPSKSIILLHGSCHNPTGMDPSEEQWGEIFEVIQKKELFPFFDLSYQGFGRDLDRDAYAIRLFAKKKLQCAVAVSNAKNFGIYAERTAALYLYCGEEKEVKNVGSQIRVIVRGIYSNPPCHGARIVQTVLSDQELTKEWRGEVDAMRQRIQEMRKGFILQLQKKTHAFDFLATQQGLFSYTGLSGEQVERLQKEYGIYLPRDGRINVAGLSAKNIEYVADAVLNVAM